MNFLDYRPFAFIISKKNCLYLFELFKDEAALKVRYINGMVMYTKIGNEGITRYFKGILMYVKK
jgi:hypothetical protein